MNIRGIIRKYNKYSKYRYDHYPATPAQINWSSGHAFRKDAQTTWSYIGQTQVDDLCLMYFLSVPEHCVSGGVLFDSFFCEGMSGDRCIDLCLCAGVAGDLFVDLSFGAGIAGDQLFDQCLANLRCASGNLSFTYLRATFHLLAIQGCCLVKARAAPILENGAPGVGGRQVLFGLSEVRG